MISGNLFTRDYLLDGIERTAQWKGLTDETVQSVRQRLHALATKFLKIAKPNEAETEKEFIYPVIEVLGWNEYQVQQILSQKGRKQVPDALLFADLAAKTLAVGEAQQWKRVQHGLAVLEAKRWNRALDRADKKAERGGCSLDADAPVSQPRRCPDQQQGPAWNPHQRQCLAPLFPGCPFSLRRSFRD